MNEAQGWYDKTMSAVSRATAWARDLVQRNYQRASLRVEMAAMRRSLDDLSREIGRIAVDRLRERGQVAPDDVAHLLRRVDELEDRVRSKERVLANLETDALPETAPVEPDPEATHPARRSPRFAPDRPPGT